MNSTKTGGPVRRAPTWGILLAIAACNTAPPPVLEFGQEILVGEPVRSRPLVLEDSIFAAPVTDILAVGDELIFPESRAHEIIVLDTLFNFRRRIGREGQGPGELRYPTDVEVTPSGFIATSEVGNARVSVFDLNGRFINTYAPTGQLTQVPLTDSTFAITPQQPGRRLSVVGSQKLEPFGPVEPSNDDAFDDFQYLLPARMRDGQPVFAHIRGSDRSFEIFDMEGNQVRSVPAPTIRTLEDLQRENERQVREDSKRLNARVLGVSEISVGQTSPDGRWIPISYHEWKTTYLYDVWNDRFHPIRYAVGERFLPARGSTVLGSTLYVYLSQRGLFAYQIDLPE